MPRFKHPTKLHACPVVKDGTEPFKHSLKYLSKINDDKWLLKDVTITYFKKVSFVFYGQISCISNNGQIRLQYIKYRNLQDINSGIFDFINVFHSFWFHYKQIHMITYKQKDVTLEILDILKMKMAQSFIYFNNLKALQNKNIIKVVTADYTKKYMAEVLGIKNGILISSEFTTKAKTFLFDINRPNRHLLLKKNVYLNEQRRLLEWSITQLLKIVDNYKGLFVNEIVMNRKRIRCIEDTKQKHDEDTTDTKAYASYLEWDNTAVYNEIKKELIRSENTTAFNVLSGSGTRDMKTKLYNTAQWGGTNKIVKRWIPTYTKPRKTRWKWIPLKNRYISSKIKKKNVHRQTHRIHHEKTHLHHALKKHRRRQKRISTKKDTNKLYEWCF